MSSAQWFERICSAVSEAACRQWREPWPAARPSREGLEIPLLPSPLVRRSSRILLVALLLHAAVLFWTQHPWSALVAAVMAGSAWLWLRFGRPPDVAQRLLVAADGRFHLLVASGQVQAVHVHPASMRLGSWVLLRLSAPRMRLTVLLGPDNVEPAVLTALRRRLA